MFDLKKRSSLTLTGSRGTDEFRRAAVRRKGHGPVGGCRSADVSSSVCGSYSTGSEPTAKPGAEADDEKSPAKTSVTRKPAHLHSPAREGPDRAHNPTPGEVLPQQINMEEKPNPSRGTGTSASCVGQHRCQDSVVGGGGGSCLNAPAIPNHTSTSVSGSPSPGRGGAQSHGSLRAGGGHSPGKLSPRNRRALTAKLRTPSPVQGRMRSYSPAKSSKSLLGLHRISSERLERREKRAGKSLSVPDLVVCWQDSRIRSEKAERSPLKLLHSPNCHTPAITVKAAANRRRSLTAGEEQCSSRGPEHRHMNDTVQEEERPAANGKRLNGKPEESKEAARAGSKFSCQWTVATTEDETRSESRAEHEEEEEEEEEEEGKGDEPKDEESTEQKLFNIAKELLQTEEAYVGRLHLLDQVFCSRLTEEAGRGSFPPEVIRSIFSNISSIYSFHSRFLLPDLENCIRHWCESPGLGKVLLQHAPFLRMYADYIRNFDHAMELVRTWTERCSAFRTIIQDIQSRGVCGRLTLQHHMLEPVQRVPRYEMLLKDYLKKLPDDSPDYELAQKSLETISMAATHSNSAIQKAEGLKRLLEIYEMVGEEEVLNPTSEFLREGRLLKLAARNTSAMERHLFLFNNFLLCCSPKFSLVGQRFAVRCRIGVDGLQVQETTNEDYPNTFQICGREKALELQASSTQDRDEWMKVIREAIDVFQKKNETFRLASKELTVPEPTEELGRRAPRWIRDHEVTLCMSCMEPFNAFTRRRHHCRACGFVVCWRCSDYKVALEYDAYKLNKVCKTCYVILSGRDGSDGRKRRTLESEASAGPCDTIMSGFLQYGGDPQTWQRVWAVLTRTDPPAFHLYSVPQVKDGVMWNTLPGRESAFLTLRPLCCAQAVKPLCTVPVRGCSIEAFPQAHQGQCCFCVTQSKSSHVFTCDSLELKRSWLSALAVASLCDNSSGIRPADEDSVVNGNKENHS